MGCRRRGNANFAWVQHIIHHLAPKRCGRALSWQTGPYRARRAVRGDIRRSVVEADLVDCIIALPPQLFYGTPIPACLWFLARNKTGGTIGQTERRLRDRRGETLFVDCRKMGYLLDRTHRELSAGEVARVAGVYHAWRGEANAGEYADVAGFSKAARLADIREHGFVLTPGRYVGAADIEDDGEELAIKVARLTERLEATVRGGYCVGDGDPPKTC